MQCEIRSFIGTRSVQEDCADQCRTDCGLFVTVCDGIGSRSDGGASSRLAVQRFIERFSGFDGSDFPKFIISAAEAVDAEVYKTYGNNCGTTAVCAFITGMSLYWLSIGDSRMYILRDNRLRQITTDHNYRYVLDLRLRKGIIDKETYNKELSRGECLASFIGMGGVDIVDVSMQPISLREGDKLLLATDGLYKSLTEGTVYDIISADDKPDIIADSLMKSVMECDFPLDNTTFALIDLTKTEEVL